MPGRMDFEFQFRANRENSQKQPDSPMRILIMGDFSGRTRQNTANSTQTQTIQSIIPIDIDNFDNILQRLMPQISLNLSDTDKTKIDIQIANLDDFHPDTLYEGLGLFEALRNTRHRLNDPASFPEAAAELQMEALTQQQTAPENGSAKAQKLSEESNSDTFKRILGKPTSSSQAKPTNIQQTEAGVQNFINQLVAPYITPEADPLQPQYIAAVDEAISQHMQTILHAPSFQSAEAIWRSIWWLVSNLNNDEDLKISLLDITKKELAADINSANSELESTQCFQTIIEKGIDTLANESWSLLLGCYSFGTDEQDLSLLAALGAIASQAGGSFIAQADTKLLGCQNLGDLSNPHNWNMNDKEATDRWQALRHSAVAPWIGLALPRILMRLPYGKNTDETERFVFEEIPTKPYPAKPRHENLLWGNPAFASALLIATSFQEQGWNMQPGDNTEITDLPAYVYEDSGEKQLHACCELYLTERAAESILDKGIMPLVSYQNRNAARILRFQSIANPATALLGF